MQRLQILWRFILFFFRAKTLYQVHSPFVFEFCKKVLEDNRWFYAFSSIEPIRQKLLLDFNEIEVTDWGAGSHVANGKRRKVRDIAQSALTPPYYCRMLFRVVHHLRPLRLLEVGSSLGISTLYQSQPQSSAQLITLEGCPSIAHIARQNFAAHKTQNIQLLEGPFETTLPQALAQFPQLDYAFIDGNHREAPTLAYFEQCLEHCHENSVLIFDDIYWSAEMQSAWEKIKAHPKVSLSIDLFFMGLVFFRPEQQEKQHFRLVPAKWKPWVMGFLR
ncbi:MAG: class I SAM-dependent methyltransferase [Bacteroidota bacterium]